MRKTTSIFLISTLIFHLLCVTSFASEQFSPEFQNNEATIDNDIGNSANATDLNPDEQKWLIKHPLIRVQIADVPPYHFWQNGPKGVSVEILNRIAFEFGFKLEYISVTNWAEAIANVNYLKTLDVLPTVERTPEREGFLAFSRGYIQVPQVIFTKEKVNITLGMEDLQHKTVAVPRRYALQDILNEEYPQIKQLDFDSPRHALQAVSDGEADAFIGNLTTSQHLIATIGLNNIKLAAPTPLKDNILSFAVRKELAPLISILNKGLDRISEEEKTALHYKYLAIPKRNQLDYTVILWFWSGLLVFLLAVLAWNQTLRRKIAKSTAQLKEYSESLKAQVDERTVELRNANERLESLFEHMPNGFAEHELIFDERGNPLDYKYLDVNPAFLKHTNFPPNIVGKTIRDILPNTEDVWLRHFAPVAMTGKSSSFEEYSAKQDRFYRVHVFSRKQKHFAILFDDITEEKQIESELFQSEQTLEAALASAKLGLWDWHPTDNHLVTNSLWQEMLGYDGSDNLGEGINKFVDLVHPDDLAATQEHINDNLIGTAKFYNSELRMQRKDGSYKWILAAGNVIEKDSEGMATRMVGIHMDIDELKKLQHNLQEAKEFAENAAQTKSDFLANMSHEIRTPLNAIIGFGYLMGNSALTPKQDLHLEKMQTAANHLLGVINDILDFSKIDADALELEKTEFLIENLLRDVCAINAEESRKKNLEMLYVYNEPEPRYFIGDFLRLSQVLNNFISNAIKFTDAGSVTIEAKFLSSKEDSVTVNFTVTDTGIGLTAEHRAKLFNPFTQADQSTTRKYGGTGLGLSICKRLVEMMDSKIEVNSTPNIGTSFSFSVVLELGGPAEQPEANSDTLSSLNILVVDDIRELALTLKAMLTRFVGNVDYATSGLKGLALIENAEKPYDLILLDRNMPDMSGLELCKQIQQSDKIAKAPKIILCSGLLEENGDINRQNYDDYILKPVTRSNVLKVINQVFTQQNLTPAIAPQKKFSSSLLKDKRILLVEDTLLNQEVASTILSEAGAKVTIAQHGQEALDKLNIQSYDIVLMDIQMPVMDGYEATKKIRLDQRFKNLPIIAMTANAMPEDREKSLAVGMNAHIAKPIVPEILFDSLFKWLGVTKPQAPKQQTTKATSGSLPTIEGLDMQKGLHHTANKEALYIKILRKFAESNANAVPNIRKSITENDLKTAERLAHSLKGISGTIGALSLQQLAEKAQGAIKLENSTDIEFHLALVEAELTDLISEINTKL